MSGYRGLFKVREFRFLYAAYTLSYLGDQFAAVAISVLVFGRSGSPLLTAIAYASAWIPALVGGPLLGPLVDRLPRRMVLVVCDVARAALVGVILLPGMPVWLIILLLYAAHLATPPFVAARAAILPDILDDEAYVTGNGLINITNQVSQIAGFAVGGAVVIAIQPTGAILVNAATFLLSAVLVLAGVRSRAAPRRQLARSYRQDWWDGFRYVFTDPWLRGCLLLVWVTSAFSNAPEAIAYPYAKELGHGPVLAGVLLAAPALGMVLGAVLMTRVFRVETRDRLLIPGALLQASVLVLIFAQPPYPVVILLYFVGGIGGSFMVPLNAIFIQRVRDDFRGRAMAVAIAGLTAGQGLGFLLAGALASLGLRMAIVVGICGVLCVLTTSVTARMWSSADGGMDIDQMRKAS
ncbi:MFS transporter [Fodinicola acaciae]|uniref:MFS transporter n=1 Tax=Fodinicola acaciae TaxID=2681555 RepID=UPI0013D80DCE|nr:MFS transporter [Fodinicola acaciae]